MWIYPLKTTLVPDGDGFRLRGTKYDSTGSRCADLIVAHATAHDNTGVTLVVPSGRDEVERLDNWDGIGQRVTGTGTTDFHDVRIEAAEVIVDRTSTIAQLFVTVVNAGITRAVLPTPKNC